jgi:hypothetical protein
MIKKSLPYFVLALLLTASLHLQAQQIKSKPATRQDKPATMLKCPDVAITSLNATLVSTLLGDLQVEFPMDTVKLEAALENAGSAAIPPGTSLYLILKKNGKVIQSLSAVDILGAPGSRWAYSVNDSFQHNQKTTYTIQVSSLLRECRVSNNRAMHRIDEKKLHPTGNPDLTVSMLPIARNWKQEGSQFQSFFELAADITNNGSGESNSSSRLLFVLNEEQVVLAALRIAQKDLPTPGQTKRFSVELAAGGVPSGEFLVSAHIEHPRNEFIFNNNWSLNTGKIANIAEPPGGTLAVLDFQPWHLAGKKLSATLKITNLQNRHLRNLRLIMFRDNVPVKQWHALACSPQAQSSFQYAEELQAAPIASGSHSYRAVLCRDTGKTPPPDDQVLAAQARNLQRMVLGREMLQKSLQDKDTGLAFQFQRQREEFRIQETLVRINPGGILIQVKGNKTGEHAPGGVFQVDTLLAPSVVLGRIELETIKTGAGSTDAFTTRSAPIICQAVKSVLQKSAEKELAADPSAHPPDTSLWNSRPRPLLGIILVNGALDIYF